MYIFDDDLDEGSITCSECGEEETYRGNYLDCINQAKENGWRVVFDEEIKTYFHYCKKCKTLI